MPKSFKVKTLDEMKGEEGGQGASLTSNTSTFFVTLSILVTEMCERLTYYSISAGLILFCTSKLDIGQANATTINQVFGGFVYIIPIIGGFLADSYLGRFKTIWISSLIYIVGVFLLPAAAIEYKNWNWAELSVTGRTALFGTALVCVALGTGGIKANVGPFGAEQIESLGKDAIQTFFNWFYWVINVGALIAYAGVAYIQQEVSFAWGFFVPLVSMVLALSVFVAVKSRYVRTRPKGSILTTGFSICAQGSRREDVGSSGKKKMLSSAKRSHGGDFEDHLVDGVVSVIKVIPFCFLVIMYWAVYSQMSNTFFAQSERMDVSMGGGVNVPAAALNVFNTVAIIIMIPIVDRLIYPCFNKMGKPLTYLKRIGIGFIFATLSMIVAGIVEISRKEYLDRANPLVQNLGGQNFNASTMSVFVQIPQFALVGASEIFTSITTLEFAYNQAPVAMQGLLTGLFLAASGIGNWVSTAILAIVESATEGDPWWADEINDCKMENLMFLLAGLMALDFIIFCIVAHFYTYQDPAKFEKTDEVPVSEKSDTDGSPSNDAPPSYYNTFNNQHTHDAVKPSDGTTPF
ncbi:solute carrier family 15 member 4-like isoform X2 [Biomphalaria glabrata]|uniref:Solute carrier family 15 member 4-like isoform X2 n=1 Tax=Biomphalaria glabrata TaxID=6526 RepID=A0A9W2ZS12_BIOGL|nr:solute carrier family 15 member 4-like isoform X2 [Biomphalaria glabrata]XP_055877765.1 solute carrier family 15 member 4-like isoform X2 [Biomphalaria glabrata]XP_055877766.1 solute carrier family 15 member 4-like isoform X2 [Biomphalaria glabrata]